MSDATTPDAVLMDTAPYVRPKQKVRPIFDTRPKRIWLISFTDFMSLMVSFFVMLYSMSEPNLGDYKKVADAMSTQFSSVEKIEKQPYTAPPLSSGDSDVITLPRRYQNAGLDLRYLREIVLQKKALIPALADIDVGIQGNSIVITQPLTNRPADKATQAHLNGLAQLISGVPNQVHIVVDQVGKTPSDIRAAFALGQQMTQQFVQAGYNRPLFILVNPDPATVPQWSLRITPFTN